MVDDLSGASTHWRDLRVWVAEGFWFIEATRASDGQLESKGDSQISREVIQGVRR